MASGSRQHHSKSRTGCSQCKKRHIKCDGRPPRCRNCERRNLECEYESLGLPSAVANSRSPEPDGPSWITWSPSSLTGASQSSSPPPEPQLPPTLTYRDLELMHHYATKTCYTLGPRPSAEQRYFWQQYVPSVAQTNHYLMHNILAVAAAHIAYLDPIKRQDYREIILGHYNTALRLFRASAADVSPMTFKPVLASVILVFIISIALPNIYEKQQVVSLDTLLNPLSVLRRSLAFFGSVVRGVGPDQDALYILTGGQSEPAFIPDIPIQDALETLKSMNAISTDPAQDKLAYETAISQLYLSFSFTTTRPSDWARMVFWPRFVSAEYVALLLEKRPMALIILCHWCVPVHHAPHRWFVGNWAERFIKSTADYLGDNWDPMLRWPLEEVEQANQATADFWEPLD